VTASAAAGNAGLAQKIVGAYERMGKYGGYRIAAQILGCVTLLAVRLVQLLRGAQAEADKRRSEITRSLKEEGEEDRLTKEAESHIRRKCEFLGESEPPPDELRRQAAAVAKREIDERVDSLLQKEGNGSHRTSLFLATFARLLGNPLFLILSVIVSLPFYLLLCIFMQPYLKYIFERTIMLAFVILGVIILVFSILYVSPSDPARNILGQQATKEQIENFNKIYGLDQPYWKQALTYVKNILTFDLGRSYVGNEYISEVIGRRFPTTFQIALLSMFVCLIIAIPAGIISAVRQYSAYDYIFMFIALLGLSIPNFWLGLILVLNFALKAGWLPAMYQVGVFKSMIMPAIVLGTGMSAGIARMTRSSMLEVKRSDYVMTARAKGLSERAVTFRHILTNAMIPIVTMIGLQFGDILGGAATTEAVFNIKGIGTYVVEKEYLPDVPAVLASVVYVSLVVSVANLVVDILYTFIDPRLKTRLRDY